MSPSIQSINPHTMWGMSIPMYVYTSMEEGGPLNLYLKEDWKVLEEF